MTFSVNPAQAHPQPSPAAHTSRNESAGAVRFRDLLDIVNPLHHIPLVGTIYRKISGDVITPAFRVAGGALYGGPLGAAFAAAGVALRAVFDRVDAATPPESGKSVASAHDLAASGKRGGWMVAATRQVPEHASARESQLSSHTSPQRAPGARRGGWMVSQAYAMADERRAALVAGKVRTVA